MRKSVLLLAPLALLASPALASVDANGSTGNVDISGSVAPRCLFTTNDADITLNELAVQSGADAGKLNAAVVNAGTATLKGWCNNTAAEIHLLASPLIGAQSATTGFTNRIDFTATAAGASDTTTDPAEGQATSFGMKTGDITVNLSAAAATGLLTAGAYTGNVKVFLNPKAVPAPTS